MSLKCLILKTLNFERNMIYCYLLNTFLIILIFNLMLDEISIIYPLCMSLFILIIYLGLKMYKLYNFFTELKLLEASPKNYSDNNHIKAYIYETIENIHTKYNDKIMTLEDKLKDRNLLFSQFIHNMKTSLAVIELAVDKNSLEVLEDISKENDKQKSHLEQLLNILRFDEFSNDYIPEKVDLYKLVNSVINNNRREFIYHRVFPKILGESAYIYTDKKWCSYMIEQVISNSIKYSKSGKNIYFKIRNEKNKTYLEICDEGIGIDKEDLPRVFDLFYTGKNGRDNQNATGIGLAMVKHVAKRLGHKVAISSVINEGTCVKFTFLSKM